MKEKRGTHQVQEPAAASKFSAQRAKKCPICSDTNLVARQREGVEIDSCPKCRGVWLERGELEKIIERASIPARDAVPQVQENPGSCSQGAGQNILPSDQAANREWKPQKNFWLRELFGSTEE